MAQPKNIGDQLSDAINEAVNNQDFSHLKDTVGQALDTASQNISRSIAQAHQQARAQHTSAAQAAFNQQEALIARRQQNLAARQANAKLQSRYAGVGGQKALGYTMAVGGGILTASLASTAVGLGLGAALSSVVGLLVGAVVCGALAIPSAILLALGIRRVRLADTFKRFQGIIGPRSVCNVSELASRSRLTEARTRESLDAMLRNGWFREGHLDAGEQCLMVTDEAYREYLHAQNLYAQERQRKALEAREQAKLEAAEEKRRRDAGVTDQAQAVIDRGTAYLAEIRESNAAIPGAEISRKIDQIETVLQSIFQRAQEHPEIIGELSRLMDYYLPMTVKLLDAYEDLDAQPVQTANIRESKQHIEDTLDTLNVAFEKLLDSVFQDTAWDLESDITVLHTVLAQEGLTENPFEKK